MAQPRRCDQNGDTPALRWVSLVDVIDVGSGLSPGVLA
jgi:hypothetical protein